MWNSIGNGEPEKKSFGQHGCRICLRSRKLLSWCGCLGPAGVEKNPVGHQRTCAAICFLHLVLKFALYVYECKLTWKTRLVPDSVRWLLSRGRLGDAKKVIKRAAKINRAPINHDVMNDWENGQKSRVVIFHTFLVSGGLLFSAKVANTVLN